MVGKTQASRVMPVVSRSEGESGTVTRAPAPLNDRALPFLPAVDQAAVPIEPEFPLPAERLVLVRVVAVDHEHVDVLDVPHPAVGLDVVRVRVRREPAGEPPPAGGGERPSVRSHRLTS